MLASGEAPDKAIAAISKRFNVSKYNGNCIVNDNPYLSEEYLGKIAEVQNDLLTVKEYVALYEHAQHKPCGF